MSGICEQCREIAAKYRCPGCGVRSCSLPCVKSHKQRSGCSGKRDPTEFVRIAEFDDNRLVSDYNFLEEVLRAADVAKRQRFKRTSSASFHIKNELKDLLWQSKCRKTGFRIMPRGMSKRSANTTYFNRKRKCIYWRVEWIFDSTDLSFIDERVDEHDHLGKVLEKHLSAQSHSAAIRHKLRDFSSQPLNQLKLLFQKEMNGDKECFYAFNTEESLRDQLAYKTVVEFPVIRVVLPSEVHRFTILEDPRPPKAEPSVAVTADERSAEETMEGTTFREEEVDEEQDMDMDMFDLLDDLPGNAALLWKSLEMQPPTLMGYDGPGKEKDLEDGEISC